MVQKIIKKYSNTFVSKWIILLIDLIMVFLLFVFAYVIRFNFNIISVKQFLAGSQMIYVIAIYLTSFLIFSSYSGVIRHTTLHDSIRIFLSISLSTTMIASVTYAVQTYFDNHVLNVPFSVILIHYLLCAFFLINSRFLIKLLYVYLSNSPKENINVLIYGAGNLGLITKNALHSDHYNNYKVVGFIEDNPSKQGKIIEGIKVYSSKQVFNKGFLEKEDIKEVIIAIQGISITQKRKIANTCLNYNLKVKNIPSVDRWINDELNINLINNIKIEDLLGRDCIYLDEQNIIKGIKGKTILVTGAAGSIGSEICRQVLRFNPQQLILFDQAETAMNELFVELCDKMNYQNVKFIVGDINNVKKLENIIRNYRPGLIFHAAAYKHVPLMETNPYEAIKVNLGGTKIVADMAVKYNVERFVMISTDKAVNPTNVMGATKRLSEMYTRSLNKLTGSTKFIITRFGNVLGSNGSVIPLFKKQIENGGPVTVTHANITRYFMTIPEACQLVLEAAFMGKNGEIFVFDMGESVKIIDLAKKMIKLSGLELGKDIDIKITGLRAGEKLHEELLTKEENTVATHNPKIMIGKVQEYDHKKVIHEIEHLINTLDTMDDNSMVEKIKQMIPEFISNNSVYSILDYTEKFNKEKIVY